MKGKAIRGALSTHNARMREVFWVVLVVLISTTSFAVGALSTHVDTPVMLLPASAIFTGDAREQYAATVSKGEPRAPTSVTAGGLLVASKQGTKYHLPWCAGARTIKEENKIWFSSKEEAEAAGYKPAGNCKGL